MIACEQNFCRDLIWRRTWLSASVRRVHVGTGRIGGCLKGPAKPGIAGMEDAHHPGRVLRLQLGNEIREATGLAHMIRRPP
jgi:hypothetical protein